MAQPQRSRRWIGWALGLFGLAWIGICAGLLLAVGLGPSLLAGWLIDEQPLPGPGIEDDPAAALAIAERICPAVGRGEEVTVSGEEAARIALASMPGDQADLSHVSLHVDPRGEASLALSVELPDEQGGEPKYLNVRLDGGFALEHGWFTAARVDRLDLGSYALGRWLAGQDLTEQFNQQAANQRAQDPELAGALAAVESLRTAPGGFVFAMPEGETLALCAQLAPASVPASEPAASAESAEGAP